jgi:Lon protease-like protein
VSDETAIRVNFGKAMPLFPLQVVTLMPHALLQLHVFEPRYRQMVADALDGPGQIAMAVFAGDGWKLDYQGRPPLRSAVCVGQIMQHQAIDDGRYNIVLHGVCRARIVDELPADEDRMYRMAMLEPVGLDPVDEAGLNDVRSRLGDLMAETRLADLREAEQVCKHLRDEDVPTSAIVELISFSILGDAELRYRLLAEGDVARRAEVVEVELQRLRTMLERAAKQRAKPAPKGTSLN